MFARSRDAQAEHPPAISRSSPAFLTLFDEPGPVTLRRMRWLSLGAGFGLLIVVAVGVRRFHTAGQLDWDKWAPLFERNSLDFFWEGLRGTVKAAAGVCVLGGGAGILLALGRISRIRIVRWLSQGYIEIARTVPVLLLMFLFLFALPDYGYNPDRYWKLVLPLAISNAAAFAEIFRAGFLSIPAGQSEAGLSLGMRQHQVMSRIVFPQSIRRISPSLVSQTVGLLKDTSLGFIVSYPELLQNGRVLASFTGSLVQTYLVVAVLYFIPTSLLSLSARRLKARVDSRIAGGDSGSVMAAG